MFRGAPSSCGESSSSASLALVIMARATGIAVLCCALASCQAFLAPAGASSSVMSSSQHSTSRGQRCYTRRPRTALSMKEEATTEKAGVTEAVVVEGGSAAAAATEDAGKEAGKRSGSNRQDLYKNQPRPVRCATYKVRRYRVAAVVHMFFFSPMGV